MGMETGSGNYGYEKPEESGYIYFTFDRNPDGEKFWQDYELTSMDVDQTPGHSIARPPFRIQEIVTLDEPHPEINAGNNSGAPTEHQ